MQRIDDKARRYQGVISENPDPSVHPIRRLDDLLECTGHYYSSGRREMELRLAEMICADPVRSRLRGRELGLEASLFVSDDLRLIVNCARVQAITEGRGETKPLSLGTLVCQQLEQRGYWAHDNFRYSYGSAMWCPEHVASLLLATIFTADIFAMYVRQLIDLDAEQTKIADDLIAMRTTLMAHHRRFRQHAHRPEPGIPCQTRNRVLISGPPHQARKSPSRTVVSRFSRPRGEVTR